VLAEIAQDFSSLAAIGLDELEPVDVCAVLNESASLYTSVNASIHWEFHGFQGKHEIQATRSHLLRVFNNLISNAVDAVADTNEPRIVLELKATPSFIEVQVRDNGVGIPTDRLERVFEPRFTSKGGGTGLGLTITRSIVNQLNGHIEVVPESSPGATFRVIFK
jgi:signal transduction histidine kinase